MEEMSDWDIIQAAVKEFQGLCRSFKFDVNGLEKHIIGAGVRHDSPLLMEFMHHVDPTLCGSIRVDKLEEIVRTFKGIPRSGVDDPSEEHVDGFGRRSFRKKYVSSMHEGMSVRPDAKTRPDDAPPQRATIVEDEVSKKFEEEMAMHPSFNATQFRHVSRIFDTDRDGCISAVNFQRALIEMGINISRTSLGEYMAKSIRTGHINIEEFAEHIENVRRRVVHDMEEERKKPSPVRVHAPYVDESQEHKEHRLKRQSSLPWSHNFDRVSSLQHKQTRPDMF
eukprot:TRINITY_DN80306_c0_g1_i1.p1 TRINITY_DN80306_c0_g1~~TRINITY_DN80306_c0_g1_i1.p1  ORF type:complete len:280 (+),score=97.41 TRINITY_DN80306_c0_g1_i1:266-1105(+)